jgi:hypothetical protein
LAISQRGVDKLSKLRSLSGALAAVRGSKKRRRARTKHDGAERSLEPSARAPLGRRARGSSASLFGDRRLVDRGCGRLVLPQDLSAAPANFARPARR